ncbi:MAG: hypothetical protein NC121_16115 [Blautia sp.]|nr:hypothetical protein [Blautia sp.]
MKTLLKKGTLKINQQKKEECLKNWGVIAYGSSSPNPSAQNSAINMNDIFAERLSKTIR